MHVHAGLHELAHVSCKLQQQDCSVAKLLALQLARQTSYGLLLTVLELSLNCAAALIGPGTGP